MNELSFVFTPNFMMNEIVYLITDVEQKPKIVLNYSISHFGKNEIGNENILIQIPKYKIKYYLSSADGDGWYFADEITKKKRIF